MDPIHLFITIFVVIVVVVVVVLVVKFVIIVAIAQHIRKKKLAELPSVQQAHDLEAARPVGSDTSQYERLDTSQYERFGPRRFTYEQLSIATKQFNASELLGKGGSGSVYRGKLPDDGALVAIKCIAERSNQGVKEFNAEVSIISELRHRNLVNLKGWCHEQGKFLVVYEYMPNGSLDYLLYDDAQCAKLNWERRYAIAKGLGSALLYLHEECSRVIIHRDVKSSNVLLDEGFVAKLGDFGLSRQMGLDVTSCMTSVVAGTYGYMAPECLVGSGTVTQEADMYAFGVVLLEIVSGKRPLDASLKEYQGLLVDWVWDLYGQGEVLLAVDERLRGKWDAEEAKRMLVVGLACSHPDAESRPKMRRALEALNGTVALPDVPASKPAPSLPMSISKIMSQMGSSNASNGASSRV